MKTLAFLFTALALLAVLATGTVAHQDAYSQLGAVYPQRVKQAPDFKLQTLDGKPMRLSDFRGKPILLNFWATWCEACKEELPSMQRLHEEMAKDGIQVVAISIDRTGPGKIRGYVEEYKLTFPILLDPDQEARRQYFIMGLPTSYLIDAEGKLRGFISGAREWDSETSKRVMRILLNKDFRASR